MDFKEIIHLMGYDNFDNYYYFNEIDKSSLSYHDKKVLKILKPLSFYVQDNKILIVFFNDIQKRENNLAVQLWNSQIPFILSDEGSCIKLYTTKNVNITNNEIKLVSIDTISRNEIDTYSFLNYWNLTDELYLQKYDRNLTHKSINDYLIENLQYLTDILNNRYHITKAYKLILRVLFIRYLIDRGINIGYKDFSDNVEENQKYFLSFFDDNHELYNLFLFLKDKFNGNLFEISNDEDILSIPHDALIYIKDFLSGDIELKSGQLSLFSLYDFNIIPIEIISNVYEILLGKDNQKKDKAFYTPEYLVDYILSDTVKKHLNHNNECKVFDPSCGSGIFLVMALRLILDKNTNNEGYIDDNDKLINLVINNIYGIDYNDEAIDVTIFSLYVTMLDFKNTKTLDDFKFPNLKNDNLITMDFFDDNISHIYKDINFDFVLGNPPWGKVQNQSSYIQYMRNNNIILPDNEICIAFMFKLYKECLDSTNITLIIPSKILYKKKSSSKSFRQRLLEETIITKITELSSVRKMLFKGAYAPATIISFHNTSSYTFDNKIEYISIKPHKILNYYHLLLIEPEDIKYVKQGLLSANDWAWKTIVYGTYHDFENIKKLLYHYNTLGDISQNEKFLISRGIETHNGDEKDASHLIGKKLLKSKKSVDHYYVDKKNYGYFNKEKIHRPRSLQIFQPPFVLFSKWTDTHYSIKASYCDEEYIYKDVYNGIKGELSQSDILKNMLGLLNSSLYTYINLLFGSSIGVEREEIFLSEVKDYPYLYSDELVSKVDDIIILFSENICTNELKSKKIDEINQIVLKLFDLEGDLFIDYILNYQIPRLKGDSSIYNIASKEFLKQYEKTFLKCLDNCFGLDQVYIDVKFYYNLYHKYHVFRMSFNSISYTSIFDEEQ